MEDSSNESADSSAPRILLVDDDRAFCLALASSLRRRGRTVLVAHDYEDGLAEARAWTPEAAVVDLRMPGKGGLELIPALLEALPQIRIVVLTGYGSIGTAVESIKSGAVQYLTKPVSADDILAAIEGRSTREVSTNPPTLEEVEWEHLQRVLGDCQGNVSEAARRLGMHRRTLQRKLARGRS